MRHSIKFRVSADPVWGSETLPAILTNAHHKFQDCGPFSSGWEKFIYLPASLDYPQAPHIRLRNGNISDDITLFAPRGKTTDVEDINELAMNVLIGQARALVRARILPSYRRAYAGYKGIVGDRILYA